MWDVVYKHKYDTLQNKRALFLTIYIYIIYIYMNRQKHVYSYEQLNTSNILFLAPFKCILFCNIFDKGNITF